MRKRNNQKAFTLIELLMVIGIIGLLAVMAVAAVKIAQQKARIAKVQNDINEIYKAISAMANDTGTWPGHQTIDEVNNSANNEICADGCTFGLSSPQAGIVATDGSYGGWNGPYMRQIPADPWGNEYFFDTDYAIKNDGSNEPCDGGVIGADCIEVVVVGSYGPDGIGNEQYNRDDIIKIVAK